MSGKKQILHYGDCEIYCAGKPFCSCGLLHQLHYLDHSFAGIVFPKFESDLSLQTNGKRRRNKKQEAEAMAILESVFGKMEPPSFLDLKWDYDDYKKLLNNCFTKKEFPRGFNRLDYWLKKKVATRNC